MKLFLIITFLFVCINLGAQQKYQSKGFPNKPPIGMTYPMEDNWYLYTGKSWEPIYPLHDTAYGVLIWYDKNLLVRADSCMQVSVAFNNKNSGPNSYFDPYWLLTTWHLTKLKFEVSDNQVIQFKKKEVKIYIPEYGNW